MARGELRFGEILRLPDGWWRDPDLVWTVWDEDTWYLWGANRGNYAIAAPGQSLVGGGMAGPRGPTHGRAHPHYVGVITMSAADLELNGPVFESLAARLESGQHIVVPTFDGKLSLGTGIGAADPAVPAGHAEWLRIQEHLLTKIAGLARAAREVVVPAGVFWPDATKAACASISRGHPHAHEITAVADFEALARALSDRGA